MSRVPELLDRQVEAWTASGGRFDRGSPVSDAEIGEMEGRYSLTLPEQVVDWFRWSNGSAAQVKTAASPFPIGEMIRFEWAFDPNDTPLIERRTEGAELVEEPREPLPVVGLFGQDYLFFVASLRQSDLGTVWCWLNGGTLERDYFGKVFESLEEMIESFTALQSFVQFQEDGSAVVECGPGWNQWEKPEVFEHLFNR